MLIILLLLFITTSINATIIDGTSQINYQREHRVLRNGDSVDGFVRFYNGFTILPETPYGSSADIDTCALFSGPLDLRDTSTMVLYGDLELDSKVTLSSGGTIVGNGHVLFVSGNLTVPAHKILYFQDSTVLDAEGHTIFFEDDAHFFVDTNATLTVRNAIIKCGTSSSNIPPIQLASHKSTLAFDRVTLTMPSNLYFNQGTLFVHNDVMFNGQAMLSYGSTQPSYITQGSTLFIDKGISIRYAPNCIRDDLVSMTDHSSSIYLYGGSLQTTYTGMRLTKGSLWIDNAKEINSRADSRLYEITPYTTSTNYGSNINTMAWSVGGNYFAVAGVGGTINIYAFTGTGLSESPISSVNYGAEIASISWHPTNHYLAIGGAATNNEITIYPISNGVISESESFTASVSDTITALTWSPCGKYLAVGSDALANQLTLYRFNQLSILPIPSAVANYGNTIRTIDWAENGTHLAIGGDAVTDAYNVCVYTFNGSTLTQAATPIDYGATIRSLAWSPDARHIIVGGDRTTYHLAAFAFDGSSLSLTTSIDYVTTPTTEPPATDFITSVAFAPNGRNVIIGGSRHGAAIKLYDFNDADFSEITSADFVTTATVNAVSWHASGALVVAGGSESTFKTYRGLFRTNCCPQPDRGGIIYGNSSLGSSYNFNVTIVSGALITKGNICNDNA
jgi:WD40 repeat protein